MPTESVVAEDQRVLEDLRQHLRREWAAPDLVTGSLEPFGDGHSGHTFLVDVDGVDRAGRHVLRLSPPGVAIGGPADVGRQGRIMGALHDAGLPAPRVLAADSLPVVDGRAFALMTCVEGTTWEQWAVRSGHTRVAAEAVSTLRAIQNLPVAATGIPTEIAFSPIEEIQRWVPLLERSPASVLDRGQALRTLLIDTAARRSAPTDPVLVHGDLHYGNLLFGPDGVCAVLDWEIASLGHPLTDLGCLAVASMRRRYSPEPNPTGSVEIDLPALVALYGAEAEPAAWHIASSCLKYAAIIGFNLQLHRRGKRLDPIYESLQATMATLVEDGLRLLDTGLDGL